MWADVKPLHLERHAEEAERKPRRESGAPERPRPSRTSRSGQALRAPDVQGLPAGGPIQIGGGRVADQMVQVGYNAQHQLPWHWPVPAYLVTKGIGSGIFALLAFAWLSGLPFHAPTALAAGAATLVLLGLTTAFLVYDLERPERFLLILLRPQWRSWLPRGAIALIGFSALAGLWWALELIELLGYTTGLAASARGPLLVLGAGFAVCTAIYTAFLFGQAEGRDLWQSPLLPFHLLVQAAMVGAGGVLALAVAVGTPEPLREFARFVFLGALLIDLGVTLLGEFGMPHASEVAARAAHEISHGRYAGQFWYGAVGVGHLLPFGLALLASPLFDALAAIAAVAGLYLFEHAFVMAPQEIPNS
jgi:formate-dependent nitrite reductase membrane component NrfD